MFQTRVYRKLKLTFYFQLRFSENRAVCEITQREYWIARQGTDSLHARCMLDTQGYKWTLRMCNTYSFCTATMVAWTHLSLRYTSCLASCDSRYRCESFWLRQATNCVWLMSAVLAILHPPAILFISYLLTSYNFVSTPPPRFHCTFARLLVETSIYVIKKTMF
jgi:hypothetical protein